MRKWGLIVTLFYAAAVLLLIVPAWVVLSYAAPHKGISASDIREIMHDFLRVWVTWAWLALLIAGEALLLLVSVDASNRRLRPRTNILISVFTAGMLLGLLTFAAAISIAAAMRGDNFDRSLLILLFSAMLGPWLIWTFIFYRYSKNHDDLPARAAQWLLRGSVLELLIAVPSHVIVRRRDGCCAPAVTGWGIATGLAVMLLSFGPSVLFLYKKRLERLGAKTMVAKL